MLSVVVPVFNEEAVFDQLLARLRSALPGCGMEYEVIFVDDGSRDRTLDRLRAASQADPRIRYISLSRNFGHQTAVSAGLAHVRGRVVAIIDADLQDPPEELPRFLQRWRDGCDVVYAVRTRRKEGPVKRFAYWSFYRLLSRVASLDIPLDSGDFCVMDRRVVDVLNAMPERNRFIRGLRVWAGFKHDAVEYERASRAAGESKYSLAKLVRLALDGLVSFSSMPLRLASWVGLAMCVGSFVALVLLIIWWASDFPIMGKVPRDVGGWTSLGTLILFISGLQFLGLGIMGEYLARMFDEVKGRPVYVVAESSDERGHQERREARGA